MQENNTIKRSVGRPHLYLDKDVVINLYKKDGNWKDVSSELGIAYGTMYKKLKELNINKAWVN